ncbi:uncharacterized protein LOC110869648 [Helianthus annuus]|uniref:uncharacterized protein LOC110869648 n=1 Tax=Helianthus annuus TaxID=4232 RepID=UPI000B8FCBE8|nr:uncharacterized protein LOC110869648 [Helianthus annuus]
MKIHLVVYTGGKWEIVNEKLEYVADADSSRRGLEIEPNLSYTALLSKLSNICSSTNITKLSYRLSSFSDPIDIINDEDLAIFYNFAMENIFEIYKLYVIEGFGVGSSGFSSPKKFLVPDLNFCTDEENYDVVNDSQPNPDNSFENCSRSSSITFEPGHVFNNKEDMKLELGKKCLLEHFEFKVDRSSKTRYQVSCLVDGCGWRFRARSFGDSGVFFVKSFNDKHTCSKTLTYPHVRQANPHVVAHYLKEPLKDSGRIYRCNEIVKDFRQRFQVEITTSQAWRGKSLALELLQGSSRESFAELPLYCYNLERANPGSVTHIKTDDERRFEMVFVAIGAAIRTFICNLRPVVIIDAAHLKGEFKGTLFLAVGMDGNNQILPISYGIGKSEDGECWTWFLSKLKECIGEIPEMAIISDRANSIHLAVRNVFPHVYHGLCCRHLMMNLRLPSDKKKENEKLWWKTCKSYRLSDFNESFNALCLAVPRVRHTLTSIGFGRWARAHCPGNRYHYMTSNSAESINALSRHSRKMPVTQLLEFFRQSVQKWFYDRRLQGIHEKHLLTQWAQKKIFKKIEGSRTWTVAGIELNSYSVADSGKGGLVDFVNGTCSCRVWQVSGLPCGHVIAVSKFLGETDCSKYCFPCYSNEVYKKTYEEAIYPLPHRSEWETPEDLINLQPPHMTKRQAGRPRENNRILSRGEEPTPLYCSRCNSYGHHRDVCRQPMPSEVRTRKHPDKGKGKETDNPDDFTQSPADYMYPSFNLGDF